MKSQNLISNPTLFRSNLFAAIVIAVGFSANAFAQSSSSYQCVNYSFAADKTFPGKICARVTREDGERIATLTEVSAVVQYEIVEVMGSITTRGSFNPGLGRTKAAKLVCEIFGMRYVKGSLVEQVRSWTSSSADLLGEVTIPREPGFTSVHAIEKMDCE